MDKESSEAEAGSAGEQLARNSLICDSDVAKRGLGSGPLFYYHWSSYALKNSSMNFILLDFERPL